MRLAPCCLFLMMLFPVASIARLQFDPAMISTDAGMVADLTQFESGESEPPGSYLVDIYINNIGVGTRTIQFLSTNIPEFNVKGKDAFTHDTTGLYPCLTGEEISGMGVNVGTFMGLSDAAKNQCIILGAAIPQAWTAFDFQRMRLDISIPQVAMRQKSRGWIPPKQWDEGINAALLNWQLSGNENRGEFYNSRSQYLKLDTGLNVGAWRLRDNSIWRNNSGRKGSRQKWEHQNTYLQRAIIPWYSELTAGDSTTSGDIFDALSFRGVQLATDENMYPDTMQGFAPVIRGIAGSHAEVNVLQNGHSVYRTNVSAGAFVINDLYPVSSGGDLVVVVKESDGTLKTFTIPYSSVPVLQREGHLRYGITVGRYRNGSNSYENPVFMQATLLRGLPFHLTAFGGAQLAENYRAVAAGLGANMGEWGALSADITHADSSLVDGTRHAGQSVRLLYGRSLVSTGTTVQLSGYRYSTEGFYTLDETALKSMTGTTNLPDVYEEDARKNNSPIQANLYNLYSNKRARLQANISQQLGDMGSLNLTANRQTYWNTAATTSSLLAGFSSNFHDINYNMSYGYTRYSGQRQAEKMFWFSFSLPLESLMLGGKAWATYGTRSNNGTVTHQTSLRGTALEDGNLNWGVTQGYGRRDGENGDVSFGYMGTYGNASMGYGYDHNDRQLRYDASGSVVLHGNGITLGQPLGTTNVLISAPGAKGIPVRNGTGIRTDWRGYTIVPYASQYRENQIALDASQLDQLTELDNAVSPVVPTRGALVKVNFKVYTGLRALLKLSFKGRPLPFGTSVSAGETGSTGLVDDSGQVYLSGLSQQGILNAQWGTGPNQRCKANYVLPERANETVLAKLQATCQ